MLDRLGDGELALWLEHNKRFPLGNSWLQTGQICSTIAGFAGKIATKDHPPQLFMPLYRPPLTTKTLYNKLLWGLVAAGSRLVDKEGNPVSLADACK